MREQSLASNGGHKDGSEMRRLIREFLVELDSGIEPGA